MMMKMLHAALEAHDSAVQKADDELLARARAIIQPGDEILVDDEWLSAGEVDYWPAWGEVAVSVNGTQLAWLTGIAGIRKRKAEAEGEAE